MRFPLALLALAAMISGCGQEFCIGPFGNCQRASPTTTTSSGLTITMETAYQNGKLVADGTTVTLTASGGAGNYTWEKSGNGSLSVTTGSSTVFSPPSPFDAADTTIVRVRDSANQVFKVALTTEE